MVMDLVGGQVKFFGIYIMELIFGFLVIWVEVQYCEDVLLWGYIVVDFVIVLLIYLIEIIKGNISELLIYGDVQKLLKEL